MPESGLWKSPTLGQTDKLHSKYRPIVVATPTPPGQRQGAGPPGEMYLLIPGRHRSCSLFPMSGLWTTERVALQSPKSNYSFTGREEGGSRERNPRCPHLLPGKDQKLLLLYRSAIAEPRVISPDIYCVSICYHVFAQAGPCSQIVPFSYFHLTRSYSNAASPRSLPRSVHSSQVLFSNLFWASFITPLTCLCSEDT